MQCEMCGKEVLKGYKAVVEGSVLKVCEQCANFGNVMSQIAGSADDRASEIKRSTQIQKAKAAEEVSAVVVDDYSQKIKVERERRNLTQEEAAKMIAEKESMLQKLESGQMVPSLQLAKKLEQFYRIKLIEEFKPDKETTKKLDFKDSALTIGDLIRMRRQKTE